MNDGFLSNKVGQKVWMKLIIRPLMYTNKARTEESKDCVLIITEGDSAKALAMSGMSLLNRDLYGIFPLRGKLINVKKVSTTKTTNSTLVKNLMTILGLKRDMKADETEIRRDHANDRSSK